jgi:hypothetical protein
MSIKLIKTNTSHKCNKCFGTAFVLIGSSKACYNCGLYIFPELYDIKKKEKKL